MARDTPRGARSSTRRSLKNPAVRAFFALLAVLLAACGKATPNQKAASANARSAATSNAASEPASSARENVRAEPHARDASTQSQGERTPALRPARAEQLIARIRAARRATLINVWASFCGPCREEMPMLAGIATNLGREGIDVVLVSADDADDHEKAEAFLKSLDVRLPAFMAAPPLADFKLGLNPRWPGMIPATFFFDASGKLRYYWGGPVMEEEIMRVIDGFLAGKNIDGESDFTLAPGAVER